MRNLVVGLLVLLLLAVRFDATGAWAAVAFPEIDIAAGNLLGASPETLKTKLGKPEKKQRRESQADAAKWWLYPKLGLELRVRPTKLPTGKQDPPQQVDLIRLTTPAAGRIGDLRVGSSEAALRAELGPPTIFSDAPTVFSYFAEALRFQVEQGKISAIVIARTKALSQTTSAFRPKFWLAPIDGDSSRDLRLDLVPQIRGLFQHIPIYQLVDTRAEADYAVYVYVDRPQTVETWQAEDKDKKDDDDKNQEKAKVHYLKSDSTCEVHLSVADPATNVCLPGFYRRTIVGECHDKIYQDDKNYGPAYYQRRAAEAAIAAYQDDLYKIVSCRGAVLHIDYEKNSIFINLGREQGIAKEGIEFDLLVDDKYLDTGKDRSKSFGKVVGVASNYCEVQLIKKVTKLFSTRWEDDWGALNTVPDPGSGRVAAITRLPHDLVD